MPKGVKIEVKVDVWDGKAGRVIKKGRWVKANSLLKNFILIFLAQANQSVQTVKDTGGVDRASGQNARNFLINGSAGGTTLGIVIGTGTNAVSMTDFQLQTQVTTNWAYGVSVESAQNPSVNVWRLVSARAFQNNSGAPVTIRELGLYCGFGSTFFACIDRTLHNVTVNHSASVTITYRISVTL